MSLDSMEVFYAEYITVSPTFKDGRFVSVESVFVSEHNSMM